MAIITVPSATQGRSYNVKISGDVPTPTEQARIAQYVAEQDAASQARVEKYFGAQQQQAPEAPEKGGIAGLSTALGRSVDITQQGAYSALEGLGSSTGIDWLREFGRSGAEANTKQLEESQAARTQFEDVQGVGSAASFIGETVAESAVPMGISIAGAAGTGAAAGAALTAWAGPGAALGAGAGAIIGAAGAALSQLPLFYGWNRERQKQEDVTAGRPVEVDEGTAALAAIPQASVEAFQDLFIVGKLSKLFPKAVVNKGGVLTRLVKGSVAGSVTEVPTEVGQQFLERYQAGLPLFDDDAVKEYEQAAIAAGLAGGAIGGGVAVVQGDAAAKEKVKEDELKKKQLLEDDASMQKDYEATQIFAAQNTAELAKANAVEPQAPEAPQEAPRMLPPPKAGEESKLKVAPIVNPAAYTPDMRSRAVAFATSGKNFTLGEFHQHMNEVTKTNIPKQSIANLMADLKSDRLIRTDSRTGSTSASRKFAPTKYAAQARERLDSFINQSATLEAEAKSLSELNDKLAVDLRTAEQTGTDLSGKKANPSAIGRQIDQNTADIADRLKRAADARAEAAKMPESLAPSPVERTGLPPGIKAAPLSQATPKAAAPRQEAIQQSLADNINAVKALASKKKSLSNRKLSSVEQVALDDTERKIAALKLRRAELLSQAKSPEAAIQDAQNQEAADNAKALSAQVQAQRQAAANEQAQLQMVGAARPASAPATAPVFDIKAQNVFGSLRGRLNKLGLGNVRLAAESTLGSKGEASGTYSAKQRLISLAMGIYDPKLSEQELFDRIARVMDHESIHALKSVGVFNDAEWASLTRAAKDMKYKAMKNGKLEERSYSYLDRAENMYDGVIPRTDWGFTTIAVDLISPQVLKALRKAAGKSKVKLGETVSLETIDKLIGEQTATEVAKIEFAAEEAVAEMFGDYVQGRIKFAGKPKTLFERIKTFFRGLIGASVDNGIPDAQSILDDIQSGAVGARPQRTMSQAAQPVARPQAIEPNLLASAVAQQEAANPKPTSGVRQSKISKEDWPSNNWIEKMYAENMEFPYSRTRQFAIGFDPNEKGEVQSFAAVAMVPETKTTAYIDWFQAYPGRVGVGSRAIQVLMKSARENNITLKLSPWRDGKVSKAQLIKFYKRNGFTLEKDGSMIFDPAISTAGVRQSKMTSDFTRDNPGGEWLKNKQARAEQNPDLKFMTGSITGTVGGKTNMFLPTKTLKGFAGLSDESRVAGEVQYERLLSDAKKNGFDPNQGGNKVVVGVNHYGQPYIVEGNTRLAVADALGIPTIKAEVRYWNGGEDVAGPMQPDKVLAMASTDVRQSVLTPKQGEENAREPAGRLELGRDGGAGLRSRDLAPLIGAPKIEGATGPDPRLNAVAEKYAKDNGIELYRQSEYAKINRDLSTRLADAYENMQDDPQNPDVREAYLNMVAQTIGQYRALVDGGYNFYFFDENNDPYDGNPWNAMRDLRDTKTMGVFSTEAGYGNDESALNEQANPLLVDTGIKWSYGKDGEKNVRVLANDLFRAVHDAFGHGLEGAGFRARGEENAWQAHARLFTGTALHAMTSETRGQNSWLNFGPYGAENENAKVGDTTFATQKIGLMPSWTWTEGKAGDQKKPLSDQLESRQSKMIADIKPVSNVPEELSRLTVLDMMDPKTGVYIQQPGKKITVIDSINKLFDRRSDVVITPDDPNAAERIAELISLEAQMAILRNPGAIGWYGETLAMAKRVAAIMYPEICPVNPYTGEPSNSYSQTAEHIWDLATAITSNGQAVLDNFTHAAEQYEYWKVHGRFKLVGYGKQSTGIVSGLKFYNSMRDVGYSDEEIAKFFSMKMTVSDLKKNPIIKQLGIKIGSSEKATTEVYGSYVLGPKIGQGFYQNLRGNFTPLTMDIWFNRLFNRITGRPFTIVTDKTRLENFDRITRLIENPMLNDYEKGLLEAAKEVADIDVITPHNVGDLAIAYDKLFQRDFTNMKSKEIKRLVALGYDPKSDETKALGNAARPVKTELIQSMSTASKNFQQSEQAAPRGGAERAFMREVIAIAQGKVRNNTGIDVNTADFQALLWYAEKQLFKAMNVREGRGGDNDYVDGVIHFLRNKGISDDEIKRVLPASQRDRLTSGTDSARQNAGVLSEPEGSDTRQENVSNLDVPATPVRADEATVARNGGVGGRVKPKRGVEAVAAAKVEDVERLSRMVAHAPQGKATPFTGQSDLMKHTDSLRYAAVQGAVSRLIQRTAGKYFKIDPKIIDDKTAGFFKKMQDDMIYVGKMYDSLRAKGINIPQEYDSYFQDQLMRDTAGAKKQDFQEGFLRKIIETAVNAKFNSTNVDTLDKAVRAATGAGSYISEIVKKVGNESHAIANAYLYALHAKERNQRINEMSKGKDTQGSGMSDVEADAILNWAKTLPQSQQAALDNVDKLAQDIVWMTNDEYIQGGLIPVYNDDKAILDDGTEVDFPQYDNYVPLRGFTDLDSTEDKSEGGGGFGKFSGSKPNKAAVGRASYAGDILVNIGTQYEAAVDKAARNKVGQSMLDLIENNASEMSAIAVVLNSNPLKKVVVNGTIRSVPDRDFTGDITDFPILPVRRNGKEILIGFHDKNIADAMKGNVSASTPNAVMSTIHNITRTYANLLTSWNPAFVLGNLPRDIETAIFNSQQYEMKGSAGNIIKKVGPSIKAIWGVINDTGAGDPHLRMRYKQFYENGGQSVFNGMVNLSNSTASVQNIIKEVEGLDSGNALFKSKHFFTKTLLGKVEAANTAVENGTRLAFFDAMMTQLEKDGVPTKIAAKRAAYAAKNLTTNFTKGGDFRNGLNTFYLFYNASLQGSMAMMNSLVRSKKARKMAASIVVMGFMMDMMNAAASDDEDDDGILDYDNFNENRLTKYILIPDFTGTGTHISIPMAYGLNIFYNAGRTLSNYVRGVAGAKGTYTASEAAASTVGQVVSTLNPFGGNNMLSFLSPTQTDLIVELMTNKDFKDQPIYKELSPFDQSKSRSNLYWSTTSPSAVFVSKFLNDTLGGGTDVIPGEILGRRMDIQPDVIEHVLGFITGGLGSFLGASLDTATSTLPDAMSGKWSADMVGKTPVLNKFLTQVSEKDKAGDYYTNRDKVMVVRAEIKDAIAAGDGERIAAAKATYPERIKVMGRIGEIEKRLTKLRKMKKLVTESTTMDEAKKQKSIDNINQAINKLMALGNQIMGDAGV